MYQYEFINPHEMIFSDDFEVIQSFLNNVFINEIGWHYFTDLIWIYHQVKHWPSDTRILDAGGGGGPVQFLLAEMGFNVTNIDLQLSVSPPFVLKHMYHYHYNQLNSYRATDYLEQFNPKPSKSIHHKLKKISLKTVKKALKHFHHYIALASDTWRKKYGFYNRKRGTINYIAANLCSLPEISDNSFDGIVSLSALEHISEKDISDGIHEITRILRQNALWAVTTSGTEKTNSWFHKPSKGWCFSENDLKRLFQATSVNRIPPALVLNTYKNCLYLKNNLASFYKPSGEFGMPWGIWNPKYIPVGITQKQH